MLNVKYPLERSEETIRTSKIGMTFQPAKNQKTWVSLRAQTMMKYCTINTSNIGKRTDPNSRTHFQCKNREVREEGSGVRKLLFFLSTALFIAVSRREPSLGEFGI